MSTLADSVSRRYLKRASLRVAAEEKTVPPARFMDIIVFDLAYKAYAQWLDGQGKDPNTNAQMKAGFILLKRFDGEFDAAFSQHIQPLENRTDTAALRPALLMAQRPGTVQVQGANRATFFMKLFSWLRSRPTLLGDLFPGRANRAAKLLAQLADEETPEALLYGLAGIPASSTLTTLTKWAKTAAKEAGVAPGPVAESLTDAKSAEPLAEALRQVEGKIQTATPMTPEFAALQEKKQRVVEQLEDLAQNSPDPGVVVSAVAATTLSPTAKEAGLNEEQTAALLAEGRVVITAGAGAGKCIVGETLVQTERGFLPIEVLAEGLDPDKDIPLQLLVHGRNGLENTSDIYNAGYCVTRRIETTLGYELEGTEPHKVLCLQDGIVDWKELQNIQIGDAVCLDRRPGLFSKNPFKRDPADPNTGIPEELTPQVASLLGYILSEGYTWSDSWYVGITTADEEQAALYRKSMEGLITYQERKDERHLPQFVFEFSRHADVQALLNFGLTRAKAQEKEIPFGVLRSPKPVITAFLRALFDGDGSATGHQVEYCTASTRLAEQLQTLLLAYGIPSRRKFRPNACSGAWHLYISGLGLKKFQKEIGFNLGAKTELLNELASLETNTNVDVIPGISDLCRAVQNQYRDIYGTTRTQESAYGTLKCIINGSRCPSFATLNRFLDFYKVSSPEWEILSNLSQGDWFFDKVIGTEIGLATTYDFVVPGTHSFSAGGFINHNTRVMAAKVAYFVREKGYRPDQILATSFTAKSAKELEDRVRDLYGITDSRIGTTHSIAREILFDFTKIDRQVIRKATQGGVINTLMELAVKQVGMRQQSSGGYGGGGYRSKYPRRYAAFGGPSTPYWKTPIGQWFNLGQDPVDNRNKPIGKKRLKTAVGLFQNKRITPEQAWADNQDRKNGNVLYFAAAIYGAYTWLKHNDPQYGPAMDFDDWLVEATKVLEQDPSALDALQRRFKVVMVDEAQDLNAVQWQLFNLIAAKADTFAVVGDDKQAIYGFRGAVPAEFTGLPGKGFDVKLLSINFRSGKHIVEAANKLIAHNGDRQIPMVCRADEARKGMGQVEAVEVPRHEDGAVLAAQEISGEVETGSSPKDFGILVRNNGEADAYCLALMSKGIPFRSKANFFGKPAVRAMMNWITIAASDNNDDTNDAVADAHSTPGFFLNREFVAGLQRRCPPGQNYLEFLVAGGRPYAGSEDWRNDKMVAPYAEVLRDIDDLRGKPMNELIEGILQIRGSKQSFLESLIDEVDPEDVAEENDTLEPTDEMIRNAALSPLRPLMEMAKKYNDPAKFLGFLKKLIRANDKNRKDDDSPEPSVMVDTIHQWKGLQAKKVYVCMAAGTFPHSSTDDAFQAGDEAAYDDERRLAYVAITRGEDRVTVISPGENYMGKPAGVSRFVEEACIGVQGKDIKEADSDPDGDAAPARTASFTAILDEFLTKRNGEGW